jgi:hypothetical protein
VDRFSVVYRDRKLLDDDFGVERNGVVSGACLSSVAVEVPMAGNEIVDVAFSLYVRIPTTPSNLAASCSWREQIRLFHPPIFYHAGRYTLQNDVTAFSQFGKKKRKEKENVVAGHGRKIRVGIEASSCSVN